LARNVKIGSGDFPWGSAISVIVVGVVIKFAIDELSLILEHGFENWRRRRLGW
jgi:hypothetical protein